MLLRVRLRDIACTLGDGADRHRMDRREVTGRMVQKKVPCEFEGCDARVPFDLFDEAVWLPVFKATRHHLGFFCERHVRELRAGMHKDRYILTFSGPDELIIDMLPLPPKAEQANTDSMSQ